MAQKVYANHLAMRFVAEDFMLLASMTDNPAGEVTTETADICLYISPVLAKKFARILTTSVAQYEAIFGMVGTEPNEQAANEVAASLPPGAKIDMRKRE